MLFVIEFDVFMDLFCHTITQVKFANKTNTILQIKYLNRCIYGFILSHYVFMDLFCHNFYNSIYNVISIT